MVLLLQLEAPNTLQQAPELRHDGIVGLPVAFYRSKIAGRLGERILVIARHQSERKEVLVAHLLEGGNHLAESCSCSSSAEVVDQVGYIENPNEFTVTGTWQNLKFNDFFIPISYSLCGIDNCHGGGLTGEFLHGEVFSRI